MQNPMPDYLFVAWINLCQIAVPDWRRSKAVSLRKATDLSDHEEVSWVGLAEVRFPAYRDFRKRRSRRLGLDFLASVGHCVKMF